MQLCCRDKVHWTTQKIPAQVFEGVENQTLMPYSGERYDTPYWAVCKVHTDHHIRFKNSLYSLPTKYISSSGISLNRPEGNIFLLLVAN